jgi:4-hydroxy-tetrahydrodipicolinate reductase
MVNPEWIALGEGEQAMAEIKVGVVGCGGRMGRMLVAEAQGAEGCRVVAGSEAPASPLVGQDVGALAGIGALGIKVAGDPASVFEAADVVLDLTVPAASVAHARLAAEKGRALVLGTTGLDESQADAIRAAAKRAPIVWAANFSLGVVLLTSLVEQAARVLGEEFDIEVLEMHHRHKVDAPSGTALALGQAAAKGRRVDLAAKSQRVRDGHTGARRTGDIGFATLRGGDVAGEHTVMFAGAAERVELTHRAGSRQIFARGVIRAARWIAAKGPGLYDMTDVLGLKRG